MAGKKDFTKSLGMRARPKPKRNYTFHRPFDDPKPSKNLELIEGEDEAEHLDDTVVTNETTVSKHVPSKQPTAKIAEENAPDGLENKQKAIVPPKSESAESAPKTIKETEATPLQNQEPTSLPIEKMPHCQATQEPTKEVQPSIEKSTIQESSQEKVEQTSSLTQKVTPPKLSSESLDTAGSSFQSQPDASMTNSSFATEMQPEIVSPVFHEPFQQTVPKASPKRQPATISVEQHSDKKPVIEPKLSFQHSPSPESREIVGHNYWAQSGHKSGTKWAQFGHNSDTLPGTNWAQIGHKPGTESGTLSGTNQPPRKIAKRIGFSHLKGNPKKVLTLFYMNCKKNCSTQTHEMPRDFIADACGIKKNSVKTTISRLIDKGLLIRASYDTGYWGGTSYLLPEHIYQEMVQLEAEGKLEGLNTTGHKLVTLSGTESGTNITSSSSIYINTTTTEEALPEDWQYIDFHDLAEIGFNSSHLEQLFKFYQKNNFEMSSQSLQESINHFAFDLTQNNRAATIKSGNPLNFFVGIMRNTRYYNPPSNFKSPEAIAQEKRLKQLRDMEAQQQKLEQELKHAEFDKWRHSLTPQNIETLVAEKCSSDQIFASYIARHGMMSDGKYSKRVEQFLSSYFEENHLFQVE